MRWLKWFFEAKKRFGLAILNYCVTSNHVHLLVYNPKEDIVPKSIQLIAGRVGREYNLRKKRKGAFWEDRYHATAVERGDHLIQCFVYIDLNMVRAGVIEHPSQWKFGGYHEIQNTKQRYSLVNQDMTADFLGIRNRNKLQEYQRLWVDEVLKNSGHNKRDKKWTDSIAVGEMDFVLTAKSKLGAKGIGRKIIENNNGFELREPQEPYNPVFDPENIALSTENTYIWNDLD
jgi:REP element-mobilizing transposase RayT